MLLYKSVTLLAFAIVFGGLTCRGAFLDFETLADGITTPTESQTASNEYAGVGVTFTGGGVALEPTFRPYSTLDPLIATLPPVTNSWFILTRSRTGLNPYDLTITFAGPVFQASGDLVVNPSNAMTATAYDAASNVLGTQIIPAGASTWIAGSFSFTSASPIASIQLLSDAPLATPGSLDNLFFSSTPVPEPGSATLMFCGLAGAWFLVRRLKR